MAEDLCYAVILPAIHSQRITDTRLVGWRAEWTENMIIPRNSIFTFIGIKTTTWTGRLSIPTPKHLHKQ